jgi:hypothetical protein
MMFPCKKCLNNYWKHEVIDGWVRSTCQFCAEEVEFPTRKKKVQILRTIKKLEDWKAKRKLLSVSVRYNKPPSRQRSILNMIKDL